MQVEIKLLSDSPSISLSLIDSCKYYVSLVTETCLLTKGFDNLFQ